MQARRDADALSAALAQVKALKQQAEENAGEAAATAALLHDLQKKMAADQAAYGANVDAAMKKIANATNLDSAQKATADLKAPAPASNQLVPLPPTCWRSGRRTEHADARRRRTVAAGGGTFDQGAIERVVNARKAGVKRTCLDREHQHRVDARRSPRRSRSRRTARSRT